MTTLQNYQDKNYKPVKNIVPYEHIIKDSRKTLKDLETLLNNYTDEQLIIIYRWACDQFKCPPAF